MLTRTLAASALVFTLAAAMTGCKSNDDRADKGSMSAQSTAPHNQACPVCGMSADAHCTVWQDGKAANCCSQACCDKFNKSSTADKQRMMSNAPSKGTSTMNSNDSYSNQYASIENKTCPMSGKAASGKYAVDMDGHRVGFCSQQCADEYRAMSPDHRAEVRAKMQ